MSTERLVEELVSWIGYNVMGAGGKGVVFGMSGGLDSSVLAVLCRRAFPRNVLGLIMPCHSSREDVEHARIVAGKFSIPTRMVVLGPVFTTLLRILPESRTGADVNRLVEANLKTRLRMLTLYYFANQLNYIVAGSSNRSELSIGYFTKYGDGGVDIIPLGSLLKWQVIELARFLGIPQVIIDKPPSAGLWEGQTDEGELGFTYEELDNYLLNGEANAELSEKIRSMITANEHKRMPPPIAEFNN